MNVSINFEVNTEKGLSGKAENVQPFKKAEAAGIQQILTKR